MPTYANTIAITEARFSDGSVVAYRDADPSHIRQARFQHILDRDPEFFSVTLTGTQVFAVDLRDGTLYPGEQGYGPVVAPTTPLRLVYYKRMEGSASVLGDVSMVFFVVGWQTTTEDGRNVKFGLKVFPDRQHWELTEDI